MKTKTGVSWKIKKPFIGDVLFLRAFKERDSLVKLIS